MYMYVGVSSWDDISIMDMYVGLCHPRMIFYYVYVCGSVSSWDDILLCICMWVSVILG